MPHLRLYHIPLFNRKNLGVALGFSTGTHSLFFVRMLGDKVQMAAIAGLGLQINIMKDIMIAFLAGISAVSHIVVATSLGAGSKIFFTVHKMVAGDASNVFFVS